MASIIAYILLAVLVIVIVIKYRAFFITIAILAAAAFIAWKFYKRKRDAKALEQAEQEALSQPSEPSKPDTVTNQYEVAGVEHYMKNLLAMMEPNYLYSYKKQDLIDTCNYDVPIYKTTIPEIKLELVQEDDNPHDPKAVVVLINDRIVGYIPRKHCKHIRHIMDNDLVVRFTCDVYGGKYKQVIEDYNWEKNRSTYSMESGEDDYGITLHITEKTE